MADWFEQPEAEVLAGLDSGRQGIDSGTIKTNDIATICIICLIAQYDFPSLIIQYISEDFKKGTPEKKYNIIAINPQSYSKSYRYIGKTVTLISYPTSFAILSNGIAKTKLYIKSKTNVDNARDVKILSSNE